MANSHHTYDLYYKLLDCPVDATPGQIKRAYRKCSLALHPLCGGDDDSFKRMKAAYDVLSVPKERDLYDRYGPDGVRVLKGKLPKSFVFLRTRNRKSKELLIVAVTIFFLCLIAFAILLSIRWDRKDKVDKKFSWFIPFVPVYLFQILVVVTYALAFSFGSPLLGSSSDQKTLEISTSAWRLAISRFSISQAFSLAFIILLPLQLDNFIQISWYFIFLPLSLLGLLGLISNAISAPRKFKSIDPAYNLPPDINVADFDERQIRKPLLCLNSKFWLFLLDYTIGSFTLLSTAILLSFLHDKTDQSYGYWLTAIPSFVLVGYRLIRIICSRLVKHISNRRSGVNNRKYLKDPSSMLGDCILWCCSYGILLVMVCTTATKLSSSLQFSTFIIFVPVFITTGALCCCAYCYLLSSAASESSGEIPVEEVYPTTILRPDKVLELKEVV